jgi:DNA-binding CsgD family transcriptional regulator
MSDTSLSDLSERELEILRLVATGASNKEIAQKLFISANTVKVHLRNIFAKIGVASRTEAAMVAVRLGLVQTTSVAPEQSEQELPASLPTPAPESLAQPGAGVLPRRISRRATWGLAGLAVIVSIVIGWGGMQLGRSLAVAQTPGPTLAVEASRWEVKADLPTPRSGLAVAAYENYVYAIGGENAQGVTGVVERYDPVADTWGLRAPIPEPVSDVSAAVIGGKIYIPGGKLAAGQMSAGLAIYNPRLNEWENGAALPMAVSAYALAAFEGRLYLFGGWDGKQYSDRVFVYDPAQDRWSELTPMPIRRAYAGATQAGDRIYVIGGRSQAGFLADAYMYTPAAEETGESPWQAIAALPVGRAGMAVVTIADAVYVVGGETLQSSQLSLVYLPLDDQWQTFASPYEHWFRPGGVVYQTNLYLVGGIQQGQYLTRMVSYKAIYTILIPVVR